MCYTGKYNELTILMQVWMKEFNTILHNFQITAIHTRETESEQLLKAMCGTLMANHPQIFCSNIKKQSHDKNLTIL